MGSTRFYTRLLVGSGLGWMIDAMNVLLLSYIVSLLEKEWSLSIAQAGNIILLNNIGLLVGAVLWGRLSDIVGRRPAFMATLLIFSIANGLSALVRNYLYFGVMRFIAGVGLGGELPVVASLVSEWGTVENRGRLVVILESFWAYGVVLAGVIATYAMLTIGLEKTLLALTALALYALVVRFTIPESPKWSMLRGRVNYAKGIVEKYGLPQEVLGEAGTRPGGVGLRGLFSRGLARSTIVAWILWFSIAFGYYGFLLWLPTALVERGLTMVKSFTFTLVMTIFAIVGYYIAVYLINPLGRRWTLALFFLLSTASALAFALSTSPTALLVSGALLNAGMSGIWGTIYAYTPELYPTEVRGVGTGSATAVARVGMILGPYVPVLLAGNFHLTLLIVTLVFAIGLVATWFGPETARRAVLPAMVK